MERYIPEGYLDVLGTASVLLAAAFAFCSLAKRIRAHGVKLLAIFLIAALSLFADHWSCYFAALFLVATALTELEFLQNLAAIIRGSKAYFDYQKEFMSQKEVEESMECEAAEIEAVDTEGGEGMIQLDLRADQLSISQFAMIVEEFALRHLERRYSCAIQRHVRYRGKGLFAQFDGIMEREGGDIILEIKASRRSVPVQLMEERTERMLERVRQYQAMTNRKAELHMVLVGPASAERSPRVRERCQELRGKETDITVEFEILTFSEIGLSQFEAEVTID